ncbi:MAG: nucleotidyltransferase [Sedimentibacter saalensis]|jgi:predicted nucleotidyltransferase|uniref:tRNA(Met) cytidine acetate ligase n=1 Tax=Sedimentibacter saalensis TaxID=130788 RepID=A0A562JGY1_9FIRM|nr:nucleotidyltransferase [Sedimentibacter saalensis]MEA5094447.1 nucleotidyltransferase [Sedimentibacter saalensis]TWH82506.1 putative nucleotidyltransferase [Sedimentibacter saalensis]
MKITGIVAEYNPFHMGHEYQLNKARELSGCDAVAVVMSGNFVQRGEPAIIDKFRRAEAAVHAGADIVIELPMPFSCQNAEMFAFAAVNELKKLHVTSLSFGCENEDPKMLLKIAKTQLSDTYVKILKEEIKKGISFPAAMTNALKLILGEESRDTVLSPNNVLAVEYMKSVMKQDLKWDFYPVRRMGKNHNDEDISGLFDSATAIRKAILSRSSQNISATEKSIELIEDFYEKFNGFNSLDNYVDILYYKIIDLGADGLSEIFEVSEGLNNKIYDNVYKHSTMDDFIMSLKSKRYTYSKLRRAMLNIILDIKHNDIKYFMLPNNHEYVKVLAFNNVGRNVIKHARTFNTAAINRFSDYKKNRLAAEDIPLFRLTNKSTNLYYLPFRNRETNVEYKENAVYINDK